MRERKSMGLPVWRDEKVMITRATYGVTGLKSAGRWSRKDRRERRGSRREGTS